MWFAMIARDHPDSLARRAAAREAHRARLRVLQDEGRLLLAGPFPAIESEHPGPNGFTGSLIVADFVSQPEAESWMQADPMVIADVYAEVEIYPFHKVLP